MIVSEKRFYYYLGVFVFLFFFFKCKILGLLFNSRGLLLRSTHFFQIFFSDIIYQGFHLLKCAHARPQSQGGSFVSEAMAKGCIVTPLSLDGTYFKGLKTFGPFIELGNIFIFIKISIKCKKAVMSGSQVLFLQDFRNKQKSDEHSENLQFKS